MMSPHVLMSIDAILTSPALAGMRAVRQWLVYMLVPSKRPGKLDKIPLHYASATPTGVNDPASWTDATTAAAAARSWGPQFGVGFCFTADCGLWFIDIDSCLIDGQWSAFAQQTCQAFAGAAVEVSSSGTGLHLFGRGTVPPHASKNAEHHAECYHTDRFVALTGASLSGNCSTDHTAALAWFVATYFPPRVASAVDAPDSGPRSDWRGPESDEELIRRALQSRSTAAAFGGDRASFADLWEADGAALARAYPGDPYDASRADAALCAHLAFWSGANQSRMERLMRQSGLAREKWDREDYLPRTIAAACGQQRDVLQDKPPPAPSAAGGAEPRYGLNSEAPFDAARVVIQRRYNHSEGPCLKAWQSMFYRWESARWIEMTEADMRAVLYAFLDAEGASHYVPTKAKVANLLDALKAAAHLDSTHEAPCWIAGTPTATASELVACANGMLHLPTRRLLPATPRFFNLNAVPFEYDPTVPAPDRWLQFLRTVWPNDPEAINTLQELFGYLLTPDTSQQKIFLIVGPKRSGKGTIARVLADMLGSANVAGPTLSGLAETFGLQPLIGKQVAIVSDARLGGRTDAKQVAENLLRISGEDRVEVGRKFLGSLTLKLGVRFVLLTNELPRIADASGAMASRFVILKMTESFFGREDPGLTRKLLDELPGILAWAVDGWQRLNARGYFVEPKSSAEAAQDLADLGSPVAAFVRDECSIGPGLQISRDAIFSAWCVWCARQGMVNRNTKDTFGADLRAAFPEISDSRPRGPSGQPRPRFYVGIGHAVQPGPPDPPSRNLLGSSYIN